MTFRRIIDSKLLGRGAALVTEALSDPELFDTMWLSAQGWCVCPVADMLDEEIIERITAWCEEHSCRRLFAFSTSNVEKLVGFEFGATLQDFEIFQDETALSSYLVLPESGPFAVLSEGSYYSLLAGEPVIVRRFLGGDPSRWIDEYHAYVQVEYRATTCKRRLEYVLERCLETSC